MQVYIGFKDANGIPTDPLPKQQEALRKFDQSKHMLVSGSLGWGKTDWLMAVGIHEALKYPKNEILMGRKHLGSFNRSTRVSFDNMIPSDTGDQTFSSETAARGNSWASRPLVMKPPPTPLNGMSPTEP